MQICSKCRCEADRGYKGEQLCEYHYWKAGRNVNWKDYRQKHPVIVSRWRKIDPELDAIFKEIDNQMVPERLHPA